MTALIRRPNPYYSGLLLWEATLVDWMIAGNAYWLKIRSGGNRVVALWWVPSAMIEPKWPDDGRTYISHYEYKPDPSQPLEIAPADVVHFRYGLDPQNIRKGLSPLGSLIREIYTDDEASTFTATILRNLGVPGLVMAPKNEAAGPGDMEQVKDRLAERTSGPHRGEPLVFTAPTDIHVVGYNPEQMNLRSMRRIPEERVTAILGVPAIVVGLGAGLDRSTFANFEEARAASYESNVIPTQRLFAEELHTQLLVDFADPTKYEIDFDLSTVRVLQEDQNALHERVREDLKAGLLTVNESLAMLGMEQRTDGDVLYVPSTLIPTRVDALIPEAVGPMGAAALAPVPAPPEEEEEEEVEPEAAARRGAPEMKAAAQFGPAILRLRERLVRASYADIANFLEAQAQRVTTTSLFEQKAESDAVFDAESEARALRATLDPWYRRALESVSDLTQFALGISFEIDDPLTRAYLAQCGELITNITRTTQQAIQQALAAGQAEGESYQQLARRIRTLPAFNQQRAMLVARTELGASTNHATMLCSPAAAWSSGSSSPMATSTSPVRPSTGGS